VLNHVSQFKYTNSMATNATYTDHNGVVHDVQQRNDIQLARDVFYFSGYAFHPKLEYNILIFTSTATLVATAAGYAGFTFTRGFALRAGYFSLPSTRSMTGTYPYFHGTDRSMSTNYFRPGFTQGIWGEGEPLDGFHYLAMLGNSLNTLDIKSANIDNRYAASATVWYDHNDFGKPWNDYEHHTSPAQAVGTAFTFAKEIACPDPCRGRAGEQRDVHLRRPVLVRDRRAGAQRHRLTRGFLPVGDRRRHQVQGPRVQRRVLSALVESLHRRHAHTNQQHVRLGLRRLARLLRAQERGALRPIIPD
jgi:hypothetical protein